MATLDRVQYVEAFFLGANETCGSPKRIAEDKWNYLPPITGADVHRPLGFTAPQYFAYGDRWAFLYCPERIVQVTSHLEDHEFLEFLVYLRAHLFQHIDLRRLSLDASESAIDALLRDLPGHRFMPAIQERLLLGT